MKEKSLRVEYTDVDGKEVILTQDIATGGITVLSRAEKDFIFFDGKVKFRKGEFMPEFQTGGGKKAPRYDEAGLIRWYETEYKEFRKEQLEKLSKIDEYI